MAQRLLLTQQPWVPFSAFPKNFLWVLQGFIDGTALYSGQRLYNVNQTHLVLASGKLVLRETKKQVNPFRDRRLEITHCLKRSCPLSSTSCSTIDHVWTISSISDRLKTDILFDCNVGVDNDGNNVGYNVDDYNNSVHNDV